MEILIKIGKKQVSLKLRDKKKILDEVVFDLKKDLSQKLLKKIENLLSRNKKEPRDVKDIKLTADIKKSYTSYRIAKIVKDAFLWSVKKNV